MQMVLEAPSEILAEEQIAHFYREGYVVIPGLAPTEEIDRVLVAASQSSQEGGECQTRIFDPRHPEKDAGVHRLLVEPNIISAVRDIFVNEPGILHGMLFFAPPRWETDLPWRRDNQSLEILGGALSAFIALSDVTPDRAMLWVAPRTHRLGAPPPRTGSGTPLPAMQKGDACIFDRNIYYRLPKNETAHARCAYLAQYQAENARSAETGAVHSDEIGPCAPARELKEFWRRRKNSQYEPFASPASE
ncbi:hypothetical protein CCAX7_25580 [Capsulimonas corticalis]|uniref:Uncharacterized protein n=1 Tax=Capsulimonas corticalis TaxID=2219043 RepID=A0A402CVR7_9BACT|nr:phytanoyl-CoA dioxygenase family protein [Capsulimonas corticalis]BDI30507.1 hypothetical protein CCAX7_25580 [Capsulimonas corticalis]